MHQSNPQLAMLNMRDWQRLEFFGHGCLDLGYSLVQNIWSCNTALTQRRLNHDTPCRALRKAPNFMWTLQESSCFCITFRLISMQNKPFSFSGKQRGKSLDLCYTKRFTNPSIMTAKNLKIPNTCLHRSVQKTFSSVMKDPLATRESTLKMPRL